MVPMLVKYPPAGLVISSDTACRLLTKTPGHADSLNRWRAIAGDLAPEEIIVANISETLRLRNCQAIPWEKGLDTV